jgi:ankyrin repeat protein
MASQMGHVEVVALLLAKNAKVDEKKVAGETALHLAAYYGHVEVVKLLISRIADQQIRIRNNKGATALDLASEKGHENVVQLIVARIGGSRG